MHKMKVKLIFSHSTRIGVHDFMVRDNLSEIILKTNYTNVKTEIIRASQDIDAHIRTIETMHQQEIIGASQDVDAHIEFIENRHQRPYDIDRVLVHEQGIEDLHDNLDNI